MSTGEEVFHRWAPISDLDDEDVAAESSEVAALVELWEEQREELSDREIRNFNDRLNREWAIETGIIENLYTIDRGTTQLLIEHGIDHSLIPRDRNSKSPELIAGIIRDHQDAAEWLFEVVRQARPLSTSFIKELHSFITGKQKYVDGVDSLGQSTRIPLNHGAYKKRPNNPMRTDSRQHEYCPPEHVDLEMERLIKLYSEHINLEIPPDVSAAWLHHRFTQIHPFQDGNGRVARALASLELIRGSWFPIVVDRDNRREYLHALEIADRGNLRLLIQLFGKIEKRWLLRALSISESVQRDTERIDQMLKAIGDGFLRIDENRHKRQMVSLEVSENLVTRALRRLVEIQRDLNAHPAFHDPSRRVFVDCGRNNEGDRRTWNRFQVISAAKHFDYFANLREYHSWVRLGLVTESGRAEILLSVHAVGRSFRGLIGATTCFYRRQEREGGDTSSVGPVTELRVTCEDMFQFSYKEREVAVTKRFETWLVSAILMSLRQWQLGE